MNNVFTKSTVLLALLAILLGGGITSCKDDGDSGEAQPGYVGKIYSAKDGKSYLKINTKDTATYCVWEEGSEVQASARAVETNTVSGHYVEYQGKYTVTFEVERSIFRLEIKWTEGGTEYSRIIEADIENGRALTKFTIDGKTVEYEEVSTAPEKPDGNNDNGNSEGNNTSGAEVSSNGVDFAGKAYYIGDRSIVAAPEEIQKLEFSNDGKVSILVFDHYDETVGDKTWGMVYKPIATAEYSQPAKKDKITIKWNEKTSVTYNLQKPSMTTSYFKQPKVGLIEIEPDDESEIFMRLNLGSWLYGEYDEDLSYSAKIEINDKDNPNFKNFLNNEYSGSLSLYYDTTDGEIVGGKYNAIKSVDTENRKIIFEKTDTWGNTLETKEISFSYTKKPSLGINVNAGEKVVFCGYGSASFGLYDK